MIGYGTSITSSLEMRQLRYFAAVMEKGSFRGAAQLLHRSQPAHTRQVRQLEEALGVQLLIRQPRGVRPTEAGRVLHEDAKRLASMLEAAIASAQKTNEGAR